MTLQPVGKTPVFVGVRILAVLTCWLPFNRAFLIIKRDPLRKNVACQASGQGTALRDLPNDHPKAVAFLDRRVPTLHLPNHPK